MKHTKFYRRNNFLTVFSISLLAILMLMCLGSGAAIAKTSYSNDNGFPYPRGTTIPYGYMGCVDAKSAISEGSTLICFGWTKNITPQEFVNNITEAKKLGVSKYFFVAGGDEMKTDSFWKAVKNKGVTDNDFFGVYFPDEPKDPSKIISMYKYMKKYFPKAVAGDYLGGLYNYSYENSSRFVPGLDICFFTSYTANSNHTRPHAATYANLIVNAPVWKKAGKTVYLTTEAYGAACKVNTSDPDLNTAKKVSDHQISQIVMGILGGAQGVFSFSYEHDKGTPCDKGWVSFMPKYKQIWPWIMKGDRKLLQTNVISGVKSINVLSYGNVDAVKAYIFTDGKGRKLVASSSMLDFTEANGMSNKAIITGVPNGKYKVLWENRTLIVTNRTIKDTWQPYGYHFYQLM